MLALLSCRVAVFFLGACRVDSRDLETKFEDGQGRSSKNSDALYQTVINIDFRSSEIPPLPEQWYLQIGMLDVCGSLESTLVSEKIVLLPQHNSYQLFSLASCNSPTLHRSESTANFQISFLCAYLFICVIHRR